MQTTMKHLFGIRILQFLFFNSNFVYEIVIPIKLFVFFHDDQVHMIPMFPLLEMCSHAN